MDKQLPEIELVSCDICLKEVPVSEAITPEAVDYVAHFCGLECYAKWRQGRESQDDAKLNLPGGKG